MSAVFKSIPKTTKKWEIPSSVVAAQMEKLPIVFTDIRPGFVKTDLLKNDKYPMLMSPQYVARKIVKAIERKKRRTVIDWRYAVLVFFWKLIPSFVWRRLPIHN